MGSSHSGKIQYTTRDGVRISYIFWDLKGKNRFPEPPGDSEINFMLSRCLDEIDATAQQIKTIKEFNSKYKYRFVILHKRKVAQAKKQRELQDLRRSSMQIHQSEFIKQTQEKSKTADLQELMKDVELNETLIKVALMKIDKYIAEKYAHSEFIAINGLQRLLQLLDKAIKINASGTKTNFSNQIELLKFFRFFSDRYPKDFYSYIPQLKNYAPIIIKAYHPVNTHMTAYCLSLLTDYLWRVQESDHIIKILETYRLEHNYQSLLSPFADTINDTDNIIMAYYNMKFINELIASVIQQDKKQLLKQNLTFVKYGYILDGIKAKLQQNYFSLQNTTFISMHQKIFKYVTKDKMQKKHIEQNRMSFRNTLNLSALHQHILMKLLDNDNQGQQQENQDNTDEMIVAYLAQSDRKNFNKFILDTLTQLQKFSKLEFQLENSTKNGDSGEDSQQMIESKIYLQNVENYFTRIKQSCMKNNCNEIMTNCFKNLQYFEKNQWKHLERFVLEELGLEKKITDELEELKQSLEEKETIIKRIIKENIQMKNQLAELRNKGTIATERNVGKLKNQTKQFLDGKTQVLNHTMDELSFAKKTAPNLPLPPKGKKIQLPELPASLGKFLPKDLPPPPNMNKQKSDHHEDLKNQKPMRDRPKLVIQSRAVVMVIISSGEQKVSSPAQTGSSILPPAPTLGSNILPPPPILGSINPPPISSGSAILPPPPTLGSTILPPPPTLGSTILPPPPTLGSNILPPPPTLGSTILPPPPTLGSTILPSPPSLGSTILPPPPTLGSTILPPPPTLGSTILPPPPTLGSTILPPPPTLGSTILPPPPALGSTILPPPPTIGSTILPPPPSLNGANLPPPPIGLPSPPGIGLSSNLPMPGIGLVNQTVQKLKEKRKPKVPLKVCNFTTLTYQRIVETVFEDIDDTKLEFNEDQLVQLFAKAIPSSKIQQQSAQTRSKSLPPLVQKQSVKILGADRWRNAQIILTKLKIAPGQITKTLIQCTGKFTSHANLESISKILPTQQQQQMIKTYDGNPQDLGKPEKFLKQLIEIPEYASRIKSMIFTNIKEEFCYELSSKVEQLRAGFTSLKENKRLKHVLLICLGLGNYLNGTTLKGGAWGFKLQTIERLEEIKSNDNKMNAAFYLIKQIWKEYPYPIFDKQEIELYQYLSKMPISQVNLQIGQLNLYCKAIEKAFKSHNRNNPKDHIGAYCQEIMMDLTIKLQQYRESNQKLIQLYQQCAKYYCEDGKKTPSDEFGKKMFQCILFISNTEKMFKIIEDKRAKQETRKAVKNSVTYNQFQNPQSNKKQDKKVQVQKKQPQKIQPKKIQLPMPPKPQLDPKLPLPPKPMMNKEQKLKQIEKIQQERQKKALQEVMMRRTSKLQAYRMSKISQVNTQQSKGIQQIDFLKGIK